MDLGLSVDPEEDTDVSSCILPVHLEDLDFSKPFDKVTDASLMQKITMHGFHDSELAY